MTDTAASITAVQAAYRALQSGDRRAARRFAEQAVALGPDRADAWLMLAALASPRASLAYMEEAARLNPASQRAARGLAWARERVAQETQAQVAPFQPVSEPALCVQPVEAVTQPAQSIQADEDVLRSVPSIQLVEPITQPAPSVQPVETAAQLARFIQAHEDVLEPVRSIQPVEPIIQAAPIQPVEPVPQPALSIQAVESLSQPALSIWLVEPDPQPAPSIRPVEKMGQAVVESALSIEPVSPPQEPLPAGVLETLQPAPRALPFRRLGFALLVIAFFAIFGLVGMTHPGAPFSAQAPSASRPAISATLPPSTSPTAIHAVTSTATLRAVTATFIATTTSTAATATPVPTQPATAVATATPLPTKPATATLPPAASATVTAVVPTTTPTSSSYVVQRGDTLSKIATRLGVDMGALISANHIANPSLIHAGQTLVVPPGGYVPNPGPGPASPPAADSQKRILVSISEQHLYAYEGDKLVLSFVASTGRNGGTATGTFRILDKYPQAWSDPWGFWMPDWMGIYYTDPTLENGIHALPELTNGKTLWGSELGTPITYGCVVLGTDDTHRLFMWADIGTPVVIVQ